jgi:hypothetical protein
MEVLLGGKRGCRVAPFAVGEGGVTQGGMAMMPVNQPATNSKQATSEALSTWGRCCASPASGNVMGPPLLSVTRPGAGALRAIRNPVPADDHDRDVEEGFRTG